MLIHTGRCILRTNIVLDDELVAEALRLTGARTKKEVVHEALRELVRLRRPRSLMDLRGKVRLARGYDYKKARSGR